MATDSMEVFEDARHPSDHRVMLEPAPRDGAPAAWLVLIWTGILFAIVLCMIVVIAAGGVL